MPPRPTGGPGPDGGSTGLTRSRHRHLTGEAQVVAVEWRSGPRTPAWDALWGRLLADLECQGAGMASPDSD